MIWQFQRQARRPTSIAFLIAVWIALAWLWVWLEASVWIIGLLALFTLPLLWDLIRNSTATIEVWPGRVVWTSAVNDGARSDIDHVRMDRRFDGSMRVTLIHTGGAQTRLPPDLRPPLAPLEDALDAAGFTVQKHPFTLF